MGSLLLPAVYKSKEWSCSGRDVGSTAERKRESQGLKSSANVSVFIFGPLLRFYCHPIVRH